MTRASRGRAFRGLAVVFGLSFLSLIGVAVTATALGGLAPWTRWQFVGLFAILEIVAGLANVVSPNIWRLPIAELKTGGHTRVQLAASTILLPHWGGLARAAAGLLLLLLVAFEEGVNRASLALVPLIAAGAVCYVAASAVLARIGVARPDVDVVQLVVRWRGRVEELAPISIGASVLQFLLSIATIPIAKLFAPSILYQPEVAPSAPTLVAGVLSAFLLVGLAYAVWAGQLAATAPTEQQREADEHA
jgi:hypothetical protein